MSNSTEVWNYEEESKEMLEEKKIGGLLAKMGA